MRTRAAPMSLLSSFMEREYCLLASDSSQLLMQAATLVPIAANHAEANRNVLNRERVSEEKNAATSELQMN
jgi:hypothetical protein